MTAALVCIHALDPAGETVGTATTIPPLVQMNTHYLRTAQGTATATSRLVHRGRTIMVVETTVRDEQERPLLLATSTHTVSTVSKT